MIKVEITKNKDNYDKIVIKGHSMYSKKGYDIVCASASSIVITSVNLIIKINEKALKYEEKEGYLSMEILIHDDIIDKVITNMLDHLNELEKQYPKNITIRGGKV